MVKINKCLHPKHTKLNLSGVGNNKALYLLSNIESEEYTQDSNLIKYRK